MQEGKAQPAGTVEGYKELEAKLQQLQADPQAESDVRIEMSVSGGMPAERYEFHFVATSGGEGQCRLRCHLTERDYEAKSLQLSQEEMARMIGNVDAPQLMRSAAPQVQIPPDSLIGRLQISDGEQTAQFIFMADPGQAETAGYEMPPQLAQLTDTIYDMAQQQLGAEDVRP